MGCTQTEYRVRIVNARSMTDFFMVSLATGSYFLRMPSIHILREVIENTMAAT